ncbi:hypothetical protein LOK49_Contig133G00007 [Camellia lanceoleosa]|nr:hypothetical protein LOK49_Contig133G00007 [Camellia lanceoleosa]
MGWSRGFVNTSITRWISLRVKEAETTNHVNATADKSNVLSPANSVILVEFCKCRVSDTVLTSGDAFSAISNDSVGLGLSYPIKFLNRKIMFPLQILVL